MLDDILNAVIIRINELFGDNTVIYTDAVEQGLAEPCFFVGFLEPSEKPMIGQRHFRNVGMYIQYLPDRSDPASHPVNRTLYQVSDVLTDGMEYITLANGDKLRGTRIRSTVLREEAVLSFFINYNHFVIKETSKPVQSMDDVGIEAKLKEE